MASKLSGKRKIGLSLLLFLSLIFLVLGIVFNTALDAIVDFELKRKLVLKNGTLGFKLWTNPPVPVDFNIYVFDIVNHDEVKQGLAKPFVRERGPYVYKMRLHKQDIVRHDFNSTISYRQPERFVFHREASVGPDTDTFTTLNIPFFTIATIVNRWPEFVRRTVNLLMEAENEDTFVRLSVHDIFWGYEDPVLKLAYKLLKSTNIHIPFITGKFGFFSGKNNTDDGLYNVFSGVDGDFTKYLQIDRWNGLRYQSVWTTAEANRISGSTGPMYPPYVTPKSNLSMFDAYISRVLQLEYVEKTSYKGVDALHFVVPFSDFDNSTENPVNSGFCTPNVEYCIPSGAYNFSSVSHGAPVYVSLPHFCGGSSYYSEQVGGLTPDPKKHQPYFDVHPLTGVSLSAARRYQINVRTESLKDFRALEHLPLSYVPILWLDGVANMDEKHTKMFRDEIQATLDAMPYVRIGVFCLSAILFLIAVFLFVYWRRRVYGQQDDEKPLLTDESSNGTIIN